MKKILTAALMVIMGAAFLYVPADVFAVEDVQAGTETAVQEEAQAQPSDEQMAKREQVLEKARSQEGYLRGGGDDIYTLAARELGYSAVNGWCGRFVWWCFYTTGNESAYYDGMFTGSPQKLIDWASENGLFVTKDQAQPGDILIRMYDGNSPHAGIIESVDEEGNIHSIERNHYNGGDGVYRFTRPDTEYIIRPKY